MSSDCPRPITAPGRLRRTVWRRCLVAFAAVAISACDGTGFDYAPAVGPGTRADERIVAFRSELARNPNDMGALNGLGREYARRGRWQESAGAYREALIVRPGDRTALIGASAAEAGLGSWSTALRYAEAAVGQRGDIAAMMAMGAAQSGAGQAARARATLEQAVAAAPRDLDVRNNLALAMALAGDAGAYGIQRGVAFAPDADIRHKRNFYLVAAIIGREANARAEGAALGIDAATVDAIVTIGRRARSGGASAFGVTVVL